MEEVREDILKLLRDYWTENYPQFPLNDLQLDEILDVCRDILRLKMKSEEVREEKIEHPKTEFVRKKCPKCGKYYRTDIVYTDNEEEICINCRPEEMYQ